MVWGAIGWGWKSKLIFFDSKEGQQDNKQGEPIGKKVKKEEKQPKNGPIPPPIPRVTRSQCRCEETSHLYHFGTSKGVDSFDYGDSILTYLYYTLSDDDIL